jgi:hypothetical protein
MQQTRNWIPAKETLNKSIQQIDKSKGTNFIVQICWEIKTKNDEAQILEP